MAFLHGFLLALGLILPLGVQNTFVFNQGAVQPKFLRTLPAVLTAAFCDLVLILVAVLGVGVIVMSIALVKYILLSVGILFLLYMGFVTWRSASSAKAAEHVEKPNILPAKKQMLFAASVSLLNPHAILDTIGVIGTSSVQYIGWDKFMYTLACVLVSFVWFLFLAAAGRVVGNINQALIPMINRCSAVIMWGSAVFLATSLF